MLTPSTCSALVHYTPNSPSGDFVGTDTFTYRASDGDAFSNTATATLTLTNAAPTATVDLTPTAPTTNQTLTATVTSSDADGDALTYTYVWKNGSTIVRTTTGTSSLTDTLDLSAAGNGDKGDTITVEVTPNDGHVDGAPATDSETVANSNPVIDSVTALPVSVDEGSGTVVSAVAHDDDGDPITYEFNCTADLDTTYEVGPQFTNSTTCTYDDGPDGHLAGVRVSDGTGLDSATTPVTVLSVAPTGTFSASTPVDEGSASTLGWTGVTDPSGADTSAGFHYSFACTSNLADLDFNYATAGTGSTHPCTFDDNGSYGVEGAVIDKDNASSTSGGSVTVLNVPPTPHITGAPASSPEGTAISLGSSVTDPSTADTTAGFTYAWSVTKNGLPFGSGGSSSTFSFTPDDNGTYVVTLDATDKDGGTGTTTATITATNVAPTATLGNNGPVNEGSPATVSFTSQSDPSSADTTAGFHYAYDCADGDLNGATYAGSGTSASATCTYDDGPSSHTVKARIIDKDGGFSEYTTSVSVLNVPPTPHITGAPASSPEGTAISLGSSVTDPSTADTTAGFTYAWSVTKNGLPFGSGGSSSTFSFTPDDNGSYVVTLDATDKDGGTGTTTATISVTNVAPASVNLTLSATTINENQSTSLSGTFTDPGTLDSHTVVINWGDGSANTTIDLAAGVLAFGPTSHQYFDDDPTATSSDVKTISVTVTDDDGGSGSGSTTVTVNNVAPSALTASALPAAINENGSTTVSGGFTDPGTLDTHSVVITWGTGEGSTTLNLAAGVLTYSASHQYLDDNPTATSSDVYSIGVSVTDDDGGSASTTTSVTVNNVAPSVTSVTIGWDQFTHVATGTATFTDPGTQDTHTASFVWTVNSVALPAVAGTVSESSGSGSASNSLILGPGCYTLRADVTVTDDDTGSGTNFGSGAAFDAYDVQFRPPIKDDVRNIAKAGSTVPVKVVINKFCGGAGTVTSLDLYLAVANGAAASEVLDPDLNVVQDAGASNDNGLKFRVADGGYIYNFSTKGLSNNSDYTLRVRVGSATGPIIKTAVLRTQK